MEFLFQISSYDDPVLDAETVELLRQRLEANSRQVAPGLWKAMDSLYAYAAKGPGREKRRRRYRVYGVLLIALGIFVLVPGLAEPRIPSLILAGGFAVAWGLWSLCLRGRKPPSPPASCRKEAAELLAGRRSVDWKEVRGSVRFDKSGVTRFAGDICETMSYSEITGVFESEGLWMVVCQGERTLLLQKKDLVSGEARDFLPYLQGKIAD